VNGAGLARDAAGRGLSVLLLEQGDLACGTSSASTKLIHGGLRYLEHYAFRLVRESLAEREVLLQAAPHIIRPVRFVLPHHSGLRPGWLIRLGLLLYDHLGGRRILPSARAVDLRREPSGAPLRPEFTRGFEYSDCLVDDSRLVVLNARGAAVLGADIRTRTRCIRARRADGVWLLTLEGGAAAVARALVNAAGPHVSRVSADVLGEAGTRRVRLVKGSHIVVPRLFAHDRSYIFQNADGRVCFTIPYQDDFTLIGTTDEDFCGDPAEAASTSAEESYLCGAVSAYLRRSVDPAAIVWRYAGVRPLLDDGAGQAQDATRDYALELDAPTGEPPLLTVFGGKITAYRRLAEAAMAQFSPFFPGMRGAWTGRAALPGGDFPWDGVDAVQDDLRRRYPFLSAATARRLVAAYGTLAADMLGDARAAADLGGRFGADLTEREVDWLVRTEWARTAEDVLWRRSKIGLRATPAEAGVLDGYLAGAAGDGCHAPSLRIGVAPS
jgi:glycerol-3-phosphate dehydrogenase